MNKSITNIYNLHMSLSFDNDHKLYKSLEKQCKTNNILFDKKLVIPINNYNRYDFGLYIMKDITFYDKLLSDNKININNKYFYDIMKCSCYKNILELIEEDTNNYNDIIINVIQLLNNTYNKLLSDNTDFNIILSWVYDKYTLLYQWYKLNDDVLDMDNIIGLYYFLGTLEWFHVYILKILLGNNMDTNTNIAIIGDNLLFNCYELQSLNDAELRIFFKDKYSSHAVLYLIGSNFITLYDPDYIEDESGNKIDILESLLNVKYYPFELSIAIQDKTDDTYCIFHCIRILEYINKLNITFDNIGFNILGNYINDLLPTTNESVIIHYILNLYMELKYNLL